jgi:hypothetical protein
MLEEKTKSLPDFQGGQPVRAQYGGPPGQASQQQHLMQPGTYASKFSSTLIQGKFHN